VILALVAIGAALLGAALASLVLVRRPRGWSGGELAGVAGQLIDGMHDGLAVQDSDGRLVAWNHAACQITGWDRTDAAEQLDRCTDEGLVRLGRAMVHLRRFRVREEGVDYRVTLFSDARDEMQLQAAFRDAWRQATINLAVLEASTDGIALVDDVGRALMTNQRMRELARELLGDRNAVGLERVVAGRLTDPQGWLQDLQVLDVDHESELSGEYSLAGGSRSFSRYVAPVRDPQGEWIGRLVMLRETTAVRAAERAKSELMSTVSHELRTPLASIYGYAELLAHRLPEGQHRQFAEIIHRQADRLAALIGDFLDLQRLEQGTVTFVSAPVDIGELLEEQAELFRAQSARHQLDVRLPDGPVKALGDRDRLAQVMANLLSNAIKYSPDGGCVTVEAAANGSKVTVSVRDEGIGIPADQQAHVFEKFFRAETPEARAIGGTGLGLALCRELVEAHGGRIGFESQPGCGSTFWFTLAAARAQSGVRF
jgi:signal transduction histidine kinase